jgi:hypothetical protein
VTATQLQIPEPVPGAINPAAGEAAKQRGMAQADEHTPDDWKARCDEAIRLMAARGVVFQAADLVSLCGEPDHPNRWGPRFRKAARAGLICFVEYDRSKRATVRSSICKTWIGTGAREVAA